MWGPLYVQEKLMEFRFEEAQRNARRRVSPESSPRSLRRLLADKAGRGLVRLSTLPQEWSRREIHPSDSANMAGAEE